MFSPTKRVAFQERLVEFIPTPVIEGFSDIESETLTSEDDHRRRREVIEAEDGHSTPIHGGRKRDWIWRPMEDDVSTAHDLVSLRSSTETTTVQVQFDAVNMQFDSVNGEDNLL